jgi:hypothetical protein
MGRDSSPRADVAVWAERIKSPMRKTLGGIFALGDVLIRAKDALPHGEYLSAVRLAGLEPRVAQMHTRIAKNQVLTNESSFAYLPPDYSKLYLLTQLSDASLKKALRAGHITPTMQTRDVAVLIRAMKIAELPPLKVIPKRVGINQFFGDGVDPYYSDESAAQVHGDLRDVLPQIPDESAHLFLCDPPYAKEFTWMYGAIAEEAKRILVPGGSLVTLFGHHQLPEVVSDVSEHLEFWWTIGMGHGGNLQKLFGKRVASSYKPGLWFVKDSLRDDLAEGFPIDMLQGGGADKSFHEWGQPVSWYRHWIERLTKRGEVIVDPTSGGGAALVASVESGRLALGIEVEKKLCRVTAQRLVKAGQVLEVSA